MFFFCNSKYFRGLSFGKHHFTYEEVQKQWNSYHLFESIDFEGDIDEQQNPSEVYSDFELEK